MKGECKTKDEQWEFYYMGFLITGNYHFCSVLIQLRKYIFLLRKLIKF